MLGAPQTAVLAEAGQRHAAVGKPRAQVQHSAAGPGRKPSRECLAARRTEHQNVVAHIVALGTVCPTAARIPSINKKGPEGVLQSTT